MSGTDHMTGDGAAGPAGSADVELRVRLRQLRRQRGMSQRDLLEPLHLASHTAIVDYESGRRVPAPDIIDAYERFFGLPPGQLHRLRSLALVQRANREASTALAAGAAGTGQDRLVPHQLPAAVRHFTGRAADLATLDAMLAAEPTAVVISAIGGMGGVGKTALAVHWGHRVRHRFPDGDLYIDLRGFHPSGRPVPPGEALGLLLGALGVAAERIPPSADERAGLYRTLLANRRVLVILDNASDADQVRPLLPGAPGCVTLVTSRSRLAGLVARDGATRIVLDVLGVDEARQLLDRAIGANHTTAEPQATGELAERCGRHPLALRVAAERVAATGRPSIAAVVAELADRGHRLGLLSAPEDETSAVRAVFDWSHDRLAPPAARLFRLLGLHDGPDIGVPAAAALAGVRRKDVAGALAELVAVHLLTEPAPGRYARHDLLQLYAADRARAMESSEDRRAAARRLAGWYLHAACAARAALSPSLPPMNPEPVALPGPPVRFDSPAAALAWFESERPNLIAAVRLARAYGLHTIGWQLPTAMYGYFDLRKYYADWLATHEIALECARAVGDREAQGRILCNIGNAYRPMRRDDEAIDHYRLALELFGEVGYRQGEAKVWGNIGLSRGNQSRHDEAAEAHQRSLDIFRELGDRFGEALTLTNMGEMHQLRGRYAEAAGHHRIALDIFREIGEDHGAAEATSKLGVALAHLGDPAGALQLQLAALDAFRATGDRYEEANVLAHLGDLHNGLGRRDEAVARWREALALYDQIGDSVAAQDIEARLSATGSPPETSC